MPNIKSAKKRVLVIDKKTKQNKMVRSAVKTEIKKIDALLKEGKLEEAKAQLSVAYKMIDSAASKGVLHKNNAANKKSKLATRVNNTPATLEETAAPAVEETKVEEVKVEEPVVETPVVEEKPKRTRKPKAATTETTETAATEEKPKRTRKPKTETPAE